jgi:ATP adenylyltransferase/5',5'''-P-1,P-4-tetraphosphate phosphorylase II
MKQHVQQLLKPMYVDMLLLADKWKDMALFYNGAKCGASAPDHAHLQAVHRADIPLLGGSWNDRIVLGESVCSIDGASLYYATGYVVPLFVIVSQNVSQSGELFERLLAAMPLKEGEPEPRMNVIAYSTATEGYVTLVIPRAEHRPQCYYANDASCRLVSPGTLDMAGLIVAPRESDFESLTSDEVISLLREVAMSQKEVDVVLAKMK